jgi:hypothetical protein
MYNQILGCMRAAKTAPHFEGGVVQMSHLGELCNYSKSLDKKMHNIWEYCLRTLRANPNVSASLCICRYSSLIRCKKVWQMRSHNCVCAARWSKCAERNPNRHPWPLVTPLCKSLVFGFVDADLCRCFNNPQIKYMSEYLRTYDCLLRKTRSYSVDSLGRFCITLATIVLQLQVRARTTY